ncbi:MAG TPA: hypothetical protein VNK52_03760 [Hyphomicrobiaceae bacterium]|nr:hypothetical protein [Hyphomicrobiaceae bacterium]
MVRLPLLVRIFRSFWLTNPFRMAILAFATGFLPFAVAVQYSSIGDVAYYMPKGSAVVCDAAAIAAGLCIAKHVGYLHALNWWPTFLLLMPFGLFFAFESVQNTEAVVARMLAGGMFAKRDWSGPIADAGPVLGRIWRTFFLIALPVFLTILAVMAKDWWCVVYWPLRLDVAFGAVLDSPARTALVPASLLEMLREAGCAMSNAHENDWSVSATFGSVPLLAPLVPGHDKPSLLFTQIFAAYNYALMAFWSAVLVSYFGYVLALTIVVYHLDRGRYDFQLVLNLNSADARKRRGFELMEGVFRPCVLVTIFAFMMAFFMRIQNVFLRNTEYQTIYDLLFVDIPDTFGKFTGLGVIQLMGWLTELQKTLQKFLDFGQFADPQSLLGAPAILIVLGLVTAALGHILRTAAMGAQARVLASLAERDGAPRVAAYYRLSERETSTRAGDVEWWPLSWPELRYAVRLMISGVFCYVFYRVAFVWMGYVAYRSIQGRWRERR